jgi:peptidoglycan/xylan/chitin deacetylase (PgdA/CDA1 family)
MSRPLLKRTRAGILMLAFVVATAVAVGVFGFSTVTLGISSAVFLAVFVDGIARPSSGIFYPTVTRGARDSRHVALTFDDGPDPEVTPAVMDALARYGARATFFSIGRSLNAHPQLARRLVAAGHELGNHSWRHSRWQNLFGSREHTREIARGERAIASLTGRRVKPLYRPPIGLKSPQLARVASRRHLTLVAWSLHSRDTRIADPKRVARHVLERIRPGDIVLMHDGHDHPGRHRLTCAKAVRMILWGLRKKGLQCVTVSELLNRPR